MKVLIYMIYDSYKHTEWQRKSCEEKNSVHVAVYEEKKFP